MLDILYVLNKNTVVRIVSKRFEMNLPLSVANHTLLVCLSLSRTHSLSGWHIHSLQHRSFVIPLCKRSGIRSCVTELLSDISAVQMDDPRTSAWPTDKKPSLFVGPSPLALPPLSFSESTAAVICYTKRLFFPLPRFPAGPHPAGLFGALPKEQASLWCHHISSVSNTLLFPIVLRYDVPTKGTQNGREPVLYIGWISTCANVN